MNQTDERFEDRGRMGAAQSVKKQLKQWRQSVRFY